MPSPRPAAATEFLRRLGAPPVRYWLAVRDGMLARDHGPVFAAYKAAGAFARELGRGDEAYALADDVRRLTDAVAWCAEFRPDGEAITRRDVGALRLLAEGAALYEPFAASIPFETLAAPSDGPGRA